MHRRIRLAFATAFLGGIVLILSGTQPTDAAGGDQIFRMAIHSSHNNQYSAVLGDDLEESVATYTDYQWLPQGDADVCVFATVYSTGMAYAGLNRRQGFANNDWCNNQPGLGQEDRYYRIVISDPTVCAFLVTIDNEMTPGVPCTLIPNRQLLPGGFQPHVRLETLFKNKAKKTPVRFQFELKDHRQYSVDIDGEVPIEHSSLQSDLKKVTYSGTASFRNFSTGKIGNSFPLPFHMEFLRQ